MTFWGALDKSNSIFYWYEALRKIDVDKHCATEREKSVCLWIRYSYVTVFTGSIKIYEIDPVNPFLIPVPFGYYVCSSITIA